MLQNLGAPAKQQTKLPQRELKGSVYATLGELEPNATPAMHPPPKMRPRHAPHDPSVSRRWSLLGAGGCMVLGSHFSDEDFKLAIQRYVPEPQNGFVATRNPESNAKALSYKSGIPRT